MSKNNNIRIGNIELRTINEQQEIVAWYPNIYYGKEKEYKYNPQAGFYYIPGKNGIHHHIHPDCFRNKESCYVVAFVDWNGAHDEFDLRTVGLRPWELEGEDAKDFLEVLNHIKPEDGEDD